MTFKRTRPNRTLTCSSSFSSHFLLLLLFTFCLILHTVLSLSASSNSPIEEQRFAIEPVDSNARLGESIILPCRVLHRTGPLQWTKDGFGLGMDRQLIAYPRYQMVGSEEEGDYSLEISNVQLEDDALFQCQVGASERNRGIRSRSARLTVFVPPEPLRLLQGDRLDAVEGKQIQLTCISDGGKPAAELTWLDDEGRQITEGVHNTREPLPDSKRLRSISTLTLQPNRLHHNRQLHCRAENAALEQPQRVSILLLVRYTPKVRVWAQGELRHSDGSSVQSVSDSSEPSVTTSGDNNDNSVVPFTDRSISIIDSDSTRKEDEPIQVHVGENVTIFCDADANPEQLLSVKWYRNEQLITDHTQISGGEQHSSQLQLSSIGSEWDSVRIGCEAINAVGSSGRVFRPLSVNFGPKVLRPLPLEQALTVGQSLRLHCDVRSNPPAELQWWHDGRMISKGRTLNLSSLKLSNAGQYTCKAILNGFPPVSTSTRLLIKGPPRMLNAVTQYGKEGHLLQIECLVQSLPKASLVTWRRNGRVIDVDNKNGYELITEPLSTPESTVRHVLLIRKARPFDFGEYNCSALNELGESHLLIQVQLKRQFPVMMVIGAVLAACLLVSLFGLIALWVNRRSAKGDDLAASLNKCSSGSDSNTLNLTQPANNSYNSAKLSLPETLPGNGSPTVSDLKLELSGNNNLGNHLAHGLHGHPQQIHWDHESLLLSNNNNNLLNANHLHASPYNGLGNTSHLTSHSHVDGQNPLHSVYSNRYQLLGVSNVPPNHHSVPSYVESIYNYPSSAAYSGHPNTVTNATNELQSQARTSPSYTSNYLLADSQAIAYGLTPAIPSSSVYLPPSYADYAQLIEYGSIQSASNNGVQSSVQQSAAISPSSHLPPSTGSSGYDNNGYAAFNRSFASTSTVTVNAVNPLPNKTVAGQPVQSTSSSNASPPAVPALTPNSLATNATCSTSSPSTSNANYRNYITSNGNLQCVVNTSALATHV